MSRLRDLARDEDCKIRIPEICSSRNEETVLAHVRQAGITGTALKAYDLLGAHSCHPCHMAVDGHIKTPFTHDELRLMHLEGMVRTIDWLHLKGKIK